MIGVAAGRNTLFPSGEAAGAAARRLPALREDLLLLPASHNHDGTPAWMIQDPVSNRFFRIGWVEFELLLRWQPDAEALLAGVRAETTLDPGDDDLAGLAGFLERNCLLRADTPHASGRLFERAARERRRDLRWLVHHYLFIRIPLVRPHRWLAALQPWVAFLFTRWFACLSGAVALAGLWLAARQWDTFLATAQESFTPTGIAAYLAALAGVKLLHELGHAITATRYGVRVAHMGMSLVVMLPMLYTDTSESWKLTSRRQRMAIAAAGIVTELGIAALATLGWSLTADGPLRAALFFLATTSWVLSVGVNASPFMRFDGYFLLSDALDLPNLHARASARARAFMRRQLLGWQEPDPESLPPRLGAFLVVFALLTWIYRLIVFTGIAVVVYLYFFKLLGIVLFVLEIIWFIAMPVWAEARAWWTQRSRTVPLRRHWLLAAPVVLLAVPLPWSVEAPAWIHAERTLMLHAPFAARVVAIHQPGAVEADATLVELDSPDWRARGSRAESASATLWSQLQRATAVVDTPAPREELGERLRQEIAEARSARDEGERLVLKAPFGGVLADLDPLVRTGTWVAARQPLGILVAPDAWIADAFVDQGDLRHLKIGDRAMLYLPGRFAPVGATVVAIDAARAMNLPDPMLDAAHGGPIRVTTTHGRSEVQQSLYRVKLRMEEAPPALRTQLARAAIRVEPHAPALDWLRTAASVLIRESGF